MKRADRRGIAVLLVALTLLVMPALPAAAQSGESTIAWHVTIAPSWFDPSTAPAQITPFGILYALHDSVVRAAYGTRIGPGLAEAWTESPDGLTYGLTLRHGDPFRRPPYRGRRAAYKHRAPRPPAVLVATGSPGIRLAAPGASTA